jgi:hypothetical protein
VSDRTFIFASKSQVSSLKSEVSLWILRTET